MYLPVPLSRAGEAAATPPPGTDAYTWHNVVMGGGGFVTGIIFHPTQKGLLYARTDVGGAYRWDASARRWIPLTDWLGAADVNLMGIESLALDPADPRRLYLAAGMYSRGHTAILRSDDQGATFERFDVPFAMGGNETGRFNGERLAVDPAQGNVLFFGSRHDGLWRSADRGATWRKVETFPESATVEGASTNSASDERGGSQFGGAFGQRAAVGIVCVLFAPNATRPTAQPPTLYVAVSTRGTNLFRSMDGGATWEAVPAQPLRLRPNHLVRATDNIFYLSYGLEPGPNSMTDGAVWKFDPATGAWTNITPLKPAAADQTFGYGAVAVDPAHPSTVMVTTFCHWHLHDQIFRSTNSGTSWTPLWDENTRWDHSSAPYTATRSPHWMGSLAINPFDSDQVLVSTGYGIWSCVNATAADRHRPTRWIFPARGFEETVPLALISPPSGPHLISGLGDIDGFRHDDLDTSPAQGTFSGPRFSSTRDLAFAALKPERLARIGNGAREGSHAAISDDGGATWTLLDSDPPGGSNGMGTLAFAADGGILVWTTSRGLTSFTSDRGKSWNPCLGLPSGARVVADPVRPSWFYSFDENSGKLLVSTNAAATFSATDAALPAAEGWRGAVLAATSGRDGDLWVGYRDRGLFHSSNGGASFVQLPGVAGVDAIGFGMAAPGKSFPAVYLLGKIGNLHAYFRSNDAGQSWVRINDDQHQFGSPDRPLVIGDPRVYGRVYLTTGGRGVIYGEPAKGSH
jgi:photosystem II stability/assembly factor-like uncharacterized protein